MPKKNDKMPCLFAHCGAISKTRSLFFGGMKSVGMCLKSDLFSLHVVFLSNSQRRSSYLATFLQSLRTGRLRLPCCPDCPSNSNNSEEKPRLAQASPTAVDSSEAVVLRPPFSYRGSDVLWENCFAKFGGREFLAPKSLGAGMMREQSHNILANSIASCLVAMV